MGEELCKGMSAARQISRRFGWAMGARAHSAADCSIAVIWSYLGKRHRVFGVKTCGRYYCFWPLAQSGAQLSHRMGNR